MSNQAQEFIKEQVYGWVGNLMRDLDARGIQVDTDDVATALEQVAYMVHMEPTKEDYENFLRDLNDGRGDK
jgi:hypothetical protein